MSNIISTATAVPKCKADKNTVLKSGLTWLSEDADLSQKFERLLEASHTGERYFIEPTSEVIKDKGFALRAAKLAEYGVPLGIEALESALSLAKISPQELDVLCFTSCSCPTIPAIDTKIIQALNLRSDLKRVPIFQYGCAGGVAGLALASELASQNKNVALLSVELCSLVFQPKDLSGTQLVAAALFADGAGCVILGPKVGPKIIGHASHLIPDSEHLMGYDILDDGLYLRLSRELPEALLKNTENFLSSFLKKIDLTLSEIDWWLIHPGGIKILRSLQEKLGIKDHQMRFSYEVLNQIGNVSSASVLFVLNKLLTSGSPKNGDRAFMFGIGPGLTLEAVLIQF